MAFTPPTADQLLAIKVNAGIAELAEHENIIGIKDSSGNTDILAGFLEAKSPTFSVLVGNAQIFHHALMSGVTGGILAASMIAPAFALDIYESHRRGDRQAAEAAQAKLHPIGARIVGELGVPGVKAALDRFVSEGATDEIAAEHLRQASLALERLLGRIDTEHVLDRLFAAFCIGK